MGNYERKDSFHQRAKREGFRSRAAYKLAEIQKSRKLLCRGDRVVDLGCWPGGWLQVAARAVGPSGRVVGVDVALIEPALKNENVVALCADLTDAAVPARVLDELGGRANVVLSDAAPKLSGIRPADRVREQELLETIEALLPVLLVPGGGLLLKVLDGPEAQVVERRIGRGFRETRVLRPAATRKRSSEHYLLARGFQEGR